MRTMAKLYYVGCSNFHATYNAGSYVADSPAEAIEMARQDYRDSPAGRMMGDVGAFRFWIRTAPTRDEE